MLKMSIIILLGFWLGFGNITDAAAKTPRHGVKPAIGRTTGFYAKVERVVDGDTIIANGVRYRLVGIDTPEIHNDPSHGYKCDAERRLGELAKVEAETLLLGRKVWIKPSGNWDKYKRPLVKVRYRRGKWYGDYMIRARLAARWQGHKHRWCG